MRALAVDFSKLTSACNDIFLPSTWKGGRGRRGGHVPSDLCYTSRVFSLIVSYYDALSLAEGLEGLTPSKERVHHYRLATPWLRLWPW